MTGSSCPAPLQESTSAPSPDKDGKCFFLCGKDRRSPDPVNEAVLIKWDKSRLGCYYCERTWKLEYAHTNERDREMFKKKMAKDGVQHQCNRRSFGPAHFCVPFRDPE